jgi:hypothetical protein
MNEQVRTAMHCEDSRAIDCVLATLGKAVMQREPSQLLPDQAAILAWSFLVLELEDEVCVLRTLSI